MEIQDLSWRTSDGLIILGRHWKLPGPKAEVCLVHGLGEHCGRYHHVAEFFAKSNMATLAYDRRGHGRSEGKRGDTPNYEAYLDEIARLLEEAQTQYPGKPIFLYGHSMGGNLVLNFVLQRKPLIRGVIATGSWIKLANPPLLLALVAAKLLRQTFPSFSQNSGLNPRLISKDPQVVEAYLTDPLVHNRITAAAGLAMLEAARRLELFSGKMPVPALIMHGGSDRITQSSGSEHFALRITGDVTWKRWDGLFHEIHNEPEQAEVLHFMVDWMEKVLGY
jgi:alpha-beta hydrolase superfamily lysophospholipase